MIRVWQIVTLFVGMIVTCVTQALPDDLSLNLQNANLPDAIQLVAKFSHLNVMISPKVQGAVTVHWQAAKPLPALESLLVSQGLGKVQMGNIWFIAPRDELIKRQQEETKWQAISEQSAPMVTQLWRIKYSRAEDIARLLQNGQTSLLSKRGQVRVDARTNEICIQDIASSIQLASRLITKLDVPVQQVMIEARLASVDSDRERELGLSFGVVSATESPPASVGRYSLAIAKLADGSTLDVKLAALERAGHAELISSPSLFTANLKSATIEAGEEIPYQEVSESGGTAVVFKKAVLALKVTPQVLPGGNVLLYMQINQDRPSNRMVQGVPSINTHQIMTQVLVKNGQTMVLGGIYETNQERGEQRIPWLSDLPWVGGLFTQWLLRENKRELLIFVTPKIMV